MLNEDSPFDLRTKPIQFKIDDHVLTLDPIEVEFAIQDIQSRLGPEQGVRPSVFLPDLLLWVKKKYPDNPDLHAALKLSDAFSIERVCRHAYELAVKKLTAVLKSLDSSTAE